jgi:hypothetical protein
MGNRFRRSATSEPVKPDDRVSNRSNTSPSGVFALWPRGSGRGARLRGHLGPRSFKRGPPAPKAAQPRRCMHPHSGGMPRHILRNACDAQHGARTRRRIPGRPPRRSRRRAAPASARTRSGESARDQSSCTDLRSRGKPDAGDDRPHVVLTQASIRARRTALRTVEARFDTSKEWAGVHCDRPRMGVEDLPSVG